MHAFANNPKVTQPDTSAKSPKPSQEHQVQPHREREESAEPAHDFTTVRVYPRIPPAIQPKLHVGASDDRYEQEADRIADQVVQQKPPGEADKKIKIEGRTPQQPGSAQASNENVESRLSRSSGSGASLPGEVRAFLEPRMQFDFSDTRVHTDNHAIGMNKELGARAFTHGTDIYFGKGQYQPQSSEGRRLIAHEATHVVQQSQTPSSNLVQRVLLPEVRENLKQSIIAEMATVHTDFDVGAVQAERDITAAARAEADAAKVLFSIGMALIIPGFGGAISRIGASFGVAIAQNTADVVGGAIGEAAKSAGNSAVDRNFSRNPRRLFTSITSGFEAAQREERTWLLANVHDTSVLPDMVLQDLEQYWRGLASNNESADWAAWFRVQWDRFQAQVGAIGRLSTGMVPSGPTPISNANIPVRIRLEDGGSRLALVNRTRVDHTSTWEWLWGERDIRTRYRFITWIDDDLADVATRQVSSVPTVDESEVTDVD